MAELRLESFEPALPPSMRALLSEARAGRGPLVWLTTTEGRTRTGKSYALLRGYPPLAHDEVGWAVGIAMFDEGGPGIVSVMERESLRGPAATALAALAQGIRAGVPTSPNTWKCVERVLKLVPWSDGQKGPHVPAALLEGLHVGLTSDSAISRGVALRLAQLGGESARRVLSAALEKTPGVQALADAVAALGGAEAPAPRSEHELLSRLLAAWKDTFDPKLVEAIIVAGADAATARGPLKARSKGELEGAWLALAARKDPADVDRLLGTPWPGAWKVALQRLRAFDGFPLDPRLARGLVDHAARYTSFAGRSVKTTAARIAAQHQRTKVGDAPEALLREASSKARHTTDLGPLWKAFWESPAELARRLVLADALSAANDPRGEFITLQVALDEGRADASAEKRANALLAAHLDTWSGALPGVDRGSRQFRRGFLSAARLKPDAEQLKPALAANEWRTLERLELGRMYGDTIRVVGSLLQRLPCLQALLLDEFAPEAWARELGGVFPGVKLMGSGDWVPLRRLDEFPSLEFVVARAKDARVAFEAARRSELVGLVLWGTALPESLVAFEKYELPELRLVPSMKRDLALRGWTVRLRRSQPETVAELSWAGRYTPGAFTELASLLAARGRTSLRCSAPSAVLEKVRAEAKALPSVQVNFDSASFDPLMP